jgi:hypothetical protein
MVQPEKKKDGLRQACKTGHFVTAVADCDHVLFAYSEKHNQDFVKKLFGGFTGFLQCDASKVYDILDRGPPKDGEDDRVTLVGCWGHYLERRVIRSMLGFERGPSRRARSRLRITAAPTARRGSSGGSASVASAYSLPCAA